MESDLGLTPSNDGKIIRLPIPQLTEERRKDLVKVVRQRAEDGRVAVRNVRRDVMQHLEELVRNGDGRRRRGAPRGGARPEAHRRARPQDRRAAEAQGSRDPRGLSIRARSRWQRVADPASSQPAARLGRRHRAPDVAQLGRDHHGRQRPLGDGAEAAGRGGPPRRDRARCGRSSRRRSTSASSRSPSTRSRPRTGRARADEVERADGHLRRDDRARAARPRRAGRARALHRPARPGAGRSAASGWRSSSARRSATTASTSGSRSTTAAAPSSSRPPGGSSSRASTRDEIDENTFAAQLYAPAMPDPDLLIRTSGELRISNFLLWQLAYSELVFVDTLWPDFGPRELRDAARARTRGGAAGSAAGERRSLRRGIARRRRRPAARARARLARRLVAVRARARRSALLALHEFYAMTRPLRPLVIAGYLGLVLTLLAIQLGGFAWVAGGLFATVRARVPAQGRRGHEAVGDGRRRRDGARRRLDRPRPRRPAGCCATSRRARAAGGVHACCSRSGRATRSRTSSAAWSAATSSRRRSRPGKTWEGFVAGTVATIFVTFVALYQDRDDFLSIGQSLLLGARDRRRGAARRPVRVAAQARHGREGQRARSSAATAACSTGSTRSSSPRSRRFYVILAFDKL